MNWKWKSLRASSCASCSPLSEHEPAPASDVGLNSRFGIRPPAYSCDPAHGAELLVALLDQFLAGEVA